MEHFRASWNQRFSLPSTMVGSGIRQFRQSLYPWTSSLSCAAQNLVLAPCYSMGTVRSECVNTWVFQHSLGKELKVMIILSLQNIFYFAITHLILKISQFQGLKNFFGMPYEIVHDIVRHTYNFPVSCTIYSLFLMKLQIFPKTSVNHI